MMGLLGLGALGLIIGVTEGWLRRQEDVQGGFRLTWWTVGTMLVGSTPGMVAALLWLPWPLPVGGVHYSLLAIFGVAGYGLSAGKPYIS
jgi:hypothetical protein